MKCVIIDDEPLAIRVITKHIEKTQGLELVQSFQNAFEALYYIQTKVVDLVFLDIQMPRINGLQFIKILKYRPKIIITTAYKEYALEALELGILDYLLKPIDYSRFLTAVSKAMEQNTVAVIPPSLGLENKDKYFFIKEKSYYVKILEEDILFLHGDRNYCRLQLKHRKLTLTGNLSYYASKLSNQNFARVHKSYIVALRQIDKYNADSLWIDGNSIPIGRTYKTMLMKYLEQKRF